MPTALPHPPLRLATPVHGEPAEPRLLQTCRPQPHPGSPTSSPGRRVRSGAHHPRRSRHPRRPPQPAPETSAPPAMIAPDSQRKTTPLSPLPHPRKSRPGRAPGQVSSPTADAPQTRQKKHPASPQEFFRKNSYCARGPHFRTPASPPTHPAVRLLFGYNAHP